MSSQSGETAAKPKRDPIRLALWGVAGVGVAAVVYIIAQASQNPQQSSDLRPLARGEMSKLTVPAEANVSPTHSFLDAEGGLVRIGDFSGQVTVVNLWATWCAPCITEMPTLARLAASYEGQPVRVVAISIDRPADEDKARTFIARNAPLAFYHDPKMALPFALSPPAAGMPTTIIYGPDGVERARLAGDADWSSPEARAVIDSVLSEG